MEADNIIILWVLLWFMQVCKEWLCMFAVAFCEEAVDWNWHIHHTASPPPRSLSARKLWIEITYSGYAAASIWSLSARKLWIEIGWISEDWKVAVLSLSARKLWIEILFLFSSSPNDLVAFCEEAVDWNKNEDAVTTEVGWSLSTRKLWIEIKLLNQYGRCTARRFLRGSCGLK